MIREDMDMNHDIDMNQDLDMNQSPKMKLVLPSLDYEQELMDYRQEFIDSNGVINGSGRLANYESIPEWLAWVTSLTSPHTLPPDYVVCSTYLYVREDDNKIIGMIQLRHYLSAFLEQYVGHAGYSIRPSERRKNYGTRMLHDALPILRSLGHSRVLITCDPWNVGSRQVILKNGGIYESTVTEPDSGAELERYWIGLDD